MGFPARLLNDGEEVVLDVRPHWWYLAGPAVAAVVVLAGALAAAVLSVPLAAAWVAVVALLATVGWLLARYARWASTSLVVTTERVVRRQGVLGRSGREIPLSAVSDVSYRQRLLQRLVGAGDLLLESAGRDSQEVFCDLPHPARIQHELHRQMRMARQEALPGWRGPSIPEQIDQLDDLCRRGVITRAEFDRKKSELLDRL